MTDFSIPKRTNSDTILNIIQAYYRVGAHTELVSSSEVDEMLNTTDVTGRQTSFLESIEVIEKDGRKRRLSSEGEDIAEALIADNENLAKQKLRELLNDWGFTSKIAGFVEMREGGVSEEQLTEYIESNSESDDNRGISALIDLLCWSDILEEGESNGKYTTVADPVTESIEADSSDIDQDRSSTANDDIVETEKPVKESESGSDRIEITFEFDASDDPADIEKAIKAARRALEGDLD